MKNTTQKRIDKLNNECSKIVECLDTLREYKDKATERRQEAEKMAAYPNQRYAEDWAREARHQERNITNFEEMMAMLSNRLDAICEKLDRIYKEI